MDKFDFMNVIQNILGQIDFIIKELEDERNEN